MSIMHENHSSQFWQNATEGSLTYFSRVLKIAFVIFYVLLMIFRFKVNESYLEAYKNNWI
jgi:hypothetical protein